MRPRRASCGIARPLNASVRFLGPMLTALTRVWFRLADLLAWILLCLCVLGALASPIAVPVFARMNSDSVSGWFLLAVSIAYLLIAFGAFLITRRRLTGLIFLLVPSVYWAATGVLVAAFVYLALVAVAFGLPYLLVYIAIRGRSSGAQEI